MKSRSVWTIVVGLSLLVLCFSADFVRLRRCHANAFASAYHADWHIAFLGDSITQYWSYPATNFGFAGATSADLKGIIQANVRCSCYRSVVILAGTNDILKSISTPEVSKNIDTMIATAQSQGLKVYVGTIPPLFGKYAGLNSAVEGVNVAIAATVSKRHATLLDYNSALVGHPEFSWDGVHLTNGGYGALMGVLRKAHAV